MVQQYYDRLSSGKLGQDAVSGIICKERAAIRFKLSLGRSLSQNERLDTLTEREINFRSHSKRRPQIKRKVRLQFSLINLSVSRVVLMYFNYS